MSPWLRRATAPLCVVAVVATGSCAARQQSPEIVGVDYETRVSGSGVVAAETDSDGRTIETPEAQAAAEAPAAAADGPSSVQSAALAASDAEQALRRAEAAASGSASVEPGAAAPPPAFVEEEELRLVDVRRASDSAGTVVVAQLSRDASDATSFELSSPRRCVVDVSGPRPPTSGQRTIATGDPRAPTLRVGSHANRLRLVLDLAPGVLDPCVATTDGSAVLLELGGRPQGAPPVELWAASSTPPGANAHAAYVLAAATRSTPPAVAMAEASASPGDGGGVAPGSEVAALPVVRDAPPEPP
ncbi:MAG: AMIN domain-containing protein, partial [Thermodesulfobacteriota bacterium]